MNAPSLSGFNVSRETMDSLETYLALLRKWNPKINLVSANTLAEAETRHICDSAQITSFIPKTARNLVDLGSGGGFPGIVIAIMAKEQLPDLSVTLVESDQRKASFLRTVLRETRTQAQVHAKRIEDIDPQAADVLTARALAPLKSLCGFAQRHLATGGVALFPKGKTWGKEVEEAQAEWSFQCVSHKSITDPTAVVLELRDLSHD